MARATAFAAGLLLCFLAAASAASSPGFLADTLGTSNANTYGRLSGYSGNADTEIACLQQLNFKGCRYTDCILGESDKGDNGDGNSRRGQPCPTTFVFQ
jgi:hypothetical protein